MGKKRKVKIRFGDMTADKISNKKRHPVVTELFTRCKEVNIFLIFITKTHFPVAKDVRVNTTHFLITKISNRQELQQIVINHSFDIDFDDFKRVYRKGTFARPLILLFHQIIFYVFE